MTGRERFVSLLVYSAGVLSLVLAFAFLILMVEYIVRQGSPTLSLSFLTSGPSRFPEKAGVYPALLGSLYIVLVSAVVAIPLGILTAIYLEEIPSKNRATEWVRRIVRLNVANLSGVPSIIYGMLGLALFVRAFAQGRSLVSGGLTMALLVLPVVVMTSSEALRAVPRSIREAAFGVGASQSQVIFGHVIPQALPGIFTGIILTISRAAGETAPLIVVGAAMFLPFAPQSLKDDFTTLSIQIFNWSTRPGEDFYVLAAGAIILLLAITLGLNALAIILRARLSKKAG